MTQAPTDIGKANTMATGLLALVRTIQDERSKEKKGQAIPIKRITPESVYPALIWGMCEQPDWDKRLPTYCNNRDESGNYLCNNQTEAAKPLVLAAQEAGWEHHRMACCQSCIDKREEEERINAIKGYWQKICPPAYQETTPKHEDWNTIAWKHLKKWDAGNSLFFHGETRTGKTRTMVYLLKLQLLHGRSGLFVWPDELKEAARNVRGRLAMIERWTSQDILCLDDPLFAGASDERVVDFLKDLIDRSIRMGTKLIITSQVGGKDYLEDSAKWGDMTKAQKNRVEALLARIQEVCHIEHFQKLSPVDDGEDDQPF
jgi:hypothetical protein